MMRRALAGAELANVANEGALECGRRGGRLISKKDVYNGIDRILQVWFLLFGCYLKICSCANSKRLWASMLSLNLAGVQASSVF